MLRLVTRQPRPPGFTTLRLFNSKAVFGHCPPHDFTLPDFSPAELDNRVKNAALLRLVESYRVSPSPLRPSGDRFANPWTQRHGHRAAHLDPLDLAERPNVPALDPRRYGFDIDPELLRPDFISDVLPARLHEGGLVDVTGILDWPGSQTGGKRTIEEVSKRLAEVYSSGVGYEVCRAPQFAPAADDRSPRLSADLVRFGSSCTSPPSTNDASSSVSWSSLTPRRFPPNSSSLNGVFWRVPRDSTRGLRRGFRTSKDTAWRELKG